MQFFLNDSGYVAPEAVAAFQRIGLPEAARAVSAAMSVFGLEYPLDCTVRDSILRGKMGLSPEAKDYALFKSGLFDQMEESLRRAGGGTFDGLYAQMDEYAERKSTEPCASPKGGPAERLGNSGAAEGPPSVSQIMRMRFWQVQSPDYDDYRHSYINGVLTYTCCLPPVRCNTCGKVRSDDRILPFQLPAPLHKRTEILKRRPVSQEEFGRLSVEIERELRASGVEPPAFRPGDMFEPGEIDVPSRPRADFLWSEIGSPVVSERVRRLFTSLEVKEVEFRPVTLRKLGKREAKLAPPIPETGEPEDLLDSVPLLSKTDTLGPYYHLIVHGRSGRPPGDEALSTCPDCGWERTPPAPVVRFVMLDSMWRGHDVFFLGHTRLLMVTDRIKVALHKLRATNVDYRSRAEEKTVTPFAAAIREAQCRYCGSQPCVGADLSLNSFMCNACNTEYYRYTQKEIDHLPVDLPQKEQEKRMQAILDGADNHMKKSVSKGP